MRRTPLLLAVASLVAAATPAALIAHPSDGGKAKGPERHAPAKERTGHKGPKGHKGHKGTLHLVNACVTADATESGVDLKVLSANRHMRRALAGERTFTAALDASTRIRLVGKARKAPAGSDAKRLPKAGTWDSLDAGDVVTIRWRAKRGTAAADLGPAWKVTDRGPFPKRCPLPDPAPETPPATPAPSL